MPRCIKCNYALVLWPHKNKYKCAKCSKVWNQKLIDDTDFRIWNKLQKELIKQQYPDNFEREWINYKNLRKEIRQLFKRPTQRYNGYRKEYYLKNKDKLLAYKNKWRKLHPEYNKKRHQDYYQRNKVIINFKSRQYELNNRDKVREIKHNYRLQKLAYFKARDLERYYNNRDKISQQRKAQYRLKKALALMFKETARRRPLLRKFYAKRPLFTFTSTLPLQYSRVYSKFFKCPFPTF